MNGPPILPALVAALVSLSACAVEDSDAALPFPEANHLDWPQWRGLNRDGVWRETGIIDELPDKFEPRWTVPIGNGYSGPTVASGRVYVTDRLDEPKEIERVHCFEWETGTRIWTHQYDCPYQRVSYKAGPRCSVLVADGFAYSLGTMGHLFCFDAVTGSVVWSEDLDAKYDIRMPIWGIAASPIIEDGLLIVPACGKQALLVAFDAKSGEEKWHALRDRGNYSAPIVVDHCGRRVLVIWTGDRVVGVDPQAGKELWEHPFKSKNMPLGVASPVLHDDKIYLTGFYDGSLMLRLDPDKLAVHEVWRQRGRNERSTQALHSIISTPVLRGEHIYGVDSYGEFRCLKMADGERVWEDLSAVPRARWATIHFVQQDDRTWMFNERGELILARLSPQGFEELDRGKLIDPTTTQLNRRGKGVCWSHPAFAYRHVFIRSDTELRCVDLSAHPKAARKSRTSR